VDNKERARQSIEGYLADPTDADLEWRQQHMELELNEAEARGRKAGLEEAAKECDREVKRYLNHPACLEHAAASQGCAIRIRALQSSTVCNEGEKDG